jgi:signal transduction histidine kinase
MNLFAMSALSTAILSFFLAFFVIKKKFNSSLGRIWFFIGLSVGAWSLGLWGVIRADNLLEANVYQYLFSIGGILSPIAYFRFIVSLLKLEKEKGKEIFLIYVIGIILIVLSFFPIFKVGMELVEGTNANYWIVPGPLYYIFPFFFLFVIGYAIMLGMQNFVYQKGFLRSQVLYVLVAGVVVFLGGVTNFFPQITKVYPIGNYFLIIYLVSMAYVIVRFRLMGIKFIVSRLYVYLIVAVFTYIYFQYILYVHILALSSRANLFQLMLFDLFSSLVFAIILLPFLNYIQRSSDILFFRGQNPRQLIKDLSIKIGGVIDLMQLVSMLESEFKRLLGTEKISVLIAKKGSANEFMLLEVAKGKIKKMAVKKGFELFERLKLTKKLVLRDEILDEMGISRKIFYEMEHFEAEVAMPLRTHHKTIGLLFLSQKMTQDAYSKEDIEFIEIISSQVAVAIENARLYAEIKAFNKRLKLEVKEAIGDLENTNKDLTKTNLKLVFAYEKLHKLDRAKSEFLSIASHQLRTPLTSIKGFTSLLMEGTYGKVSNQVNVVLSKIFISNERLINLVEDLLNISRIESGRFVFDLKENEICPLLESVVDSFAVPAKAKNIEIEYHHPTKKIPPFVFDKNKMQELLSNLLDNAVKYTKEGIIKVTLKQEAKKIQITIKDSGMGIPKGETEYIFDKFQRGKGVTQVNTEGVGLGLYVCKKVIEAHNGKIWAESEGIGKGSEFFVELSSDFRPKLTNIQKQRLLQEKKLRMITNEESEGNGGK